MNPVKTQKDIVTLADDDGQERAVDEMLTSPQLKELLSMPVAEVTPTREYSAIDNNIEKKGFGSK